MKINFDNNVKGAKNTLNKSLKESKQLNEGPGAGYTIEGTIDNLTIKSFEVKKENGMIVIPMDGTATITNCKAYSYGYGGEVGDVPVDVTKVVLDDFGYDEEIDEYSIKDAINGCYIKVVYGGGWSHSTFGGDLLASYENNSLKTNGYDDSASSIEMQVKDKNDIEYIDKLVTGETELQMFAVEIDGEMDNEFDNKEEAIEYAKANNGERVIEVFEYISKNGDYEDFEMGDIVWERDNESLKEGYDSNVYIGYEDVDSAKYPNLKDALDCNGVSVVVDENGGFAWYERFDPELLQSNGVDLHAMQSEVRDYVNNNYGFKKMNFGESLNESSMSQIVAIANRYSGQDAVKSVKDVLLNIAGSGRDGQYAVDNLAKSFNIDESLTESADPLVIYKSLGSYKVTPKSNYDTNISNARLVQDMKDFDSADEIIDYYVKYFGSKKDDFEVLTESLNEDYTEQDRAQALADYLGIDVADVDNIYDNEFETPEGDYLVLDEDESYQYAKDGIESIYDDIGLEAFTSWMVDWIYDNALDTDWFEDFFREDYESYLDDIESEVAYKGDYENRLIQELHENGDITDDDFETSEDGDVDYSKFIGDIDSAKESFVNSRLRDIEGSYIEEYKSNFGKDALKDVVDRFNLIDLDAVKDECIDNDGVAHFISSYDGDEHELGNGLYAYRTN